MQHRPEGDTAQKLPPYSPFTWISNEQAVRAMGSYWGKFRQASIDYRAANPESYASWKLWSDNAWFYHFNVPTIPITDESFGICQGNAGTDYWWTNYDGNEDGKDIFDMSVLIFDDSYKAWFVVDPGTIIWSANMFMWLHNIDDSIRIPKITQFKEWFLEEYGWDTTESEIYQGC